MIQFWSIQGVNISFMRSHKYSHSGSSNKKIDVNFFQAQIYLNKEISYIYPCKEKKVAAPDIEGYMETG